MNDLIDRQAAIDAISCNITVTGRQNAELVAATIGTFADRIKALPSAQPVDKAYLCDWYINSVTESEPIWTEAHISELMGDFYIIPKRGKQDE